MLIFRYSPFLESSLSEPLRAGLKTVCEKRELQINNKNTKLIVFIGVYLSSNISFFIKLGDFSVQIINIKVKKLIFTEI